MFKSASNKQSFMIQWISTNTLKSLVSNMWVLSRREQRVQQESEQGQLPLVPLQSSPNDWMDEQRLLPESAAAHASVCNPPWGTESKLSCHFWKELRKESWKYASESKKKAAKENQDWEMSLRPGKRELPGGSNGKSTKAILFERKSKGRPSALAMRKPLVRLGSGNQVPFTRG